jgi:hypothetical protein
MNILLSVLHYYLILLLRKRIMLTVALSQRTCSAFVHQLMNC